jgi:hypothetical protein
VTDPITPVGVSGGDGGGSSGSGSSGSGSGGMGPDASEQVVRAARRALVRRRERVRVIGTAVLAGMFTALWGVIGSNALAVPLYVAAGVAGAIGALAVGALVRADIRRARAVEPVVLEEVTVSRKTPRDGKLEVSAATSSQIEWLGDAFNVTSLDEEGSGTREALVCRCAKHEGMRHVHHFIVSPLFHRLAPDTRLRVVLAAAARELRLER